MFKVGDILYIKDTPDNRKAFGEVGIEITVTEADSIHVWFKGRDGRSRGGWLFDRFTLAADAQTDTTDAANYYHAIVGYSNAESVS